MVREINNPDARVGVVDFPFTAESLVESIAKIDIYTDNR